jgi:predicted Zn-dependent peptidase
MCRLKYGYLVLIFVLIFGPTSWGGQRTDELPFPIKEYTLINGLKVVLSEEHSLPIVSIVVAYKVGSTDEEPGKTGLAYLLENLMFQGSRNVGQMQHYSFVQKIGGALNAITTDDKTIFYQTVPSNQLALVLWLESDRMKSINISSSNVERMKNQLIEDIQHRKESDPYLENSWYFDRLIFPSFAYSHPVLGTIQDIQEISVEDVRRFFATHYAPNNAVITIVGHLQEEKVLQLVQKYFSSIPMRAPPPAKELGDISKIEALDLTITNPMAPSPGFYMGYQLAPRYSDDHYKLAITEYVLMKGRTSRMQKRLFEKDKTAIYMSGGIETRKGQSVLKLFVRANNKIMNERNRRAVFAEINKIKTTFVSKKELQKTKNLFKMDYFRQFRTSLDKAIFLAEELIDRGDFIQWLDELDKYLAVTHYDVSRVAGKYLKEELIFINIEKK